ncbi:hypothetical protein DF182_16410 [Chitinophaga flava]|uniref:Uncharacterized protein n=1 Tax=Chitinophaga flava TaxID=2259036 RepID=A0A365XPA7_9BACT|nr:hypothetical protein DF182_16410 [Chitinophaga flava]
MVQHGAVWGYVVQSGAVWGYVVQSGAVWCIISPFKFTKTFLCFEVQIRYKNAQNNAKQSKQSKTTGHRKSPIDGAFIIFRYECFVLFMPLYFPIQNLLKM